MMGETTKKFFPRCVKGQCGWRWITHMVIELRP